MTGTPGLPRLHRDPAPIGAKAGRARLAADSVTVLISAAVPLSLLATLAVAGEPAARRYASKPAPILALTVH